MLAEQLVWRDRHRYVAHPHLAALADGSWLLVATCGPGRATTLHPPLDPEFCAIGFVSADEGRSWSEPAPVPAYGVNGVECGGLTPLADGGVLLNQWRFRWYGEGDVAPEPVTPADALRAARAASAELDGAANDDISWARGGGTTTVWRGTARAPALARPGGDRHGPIRRRLRVARRRHLPRR